MIDYGDLFAKIGAGLGSIGITWAGIFRPIKKIMARRNEESNKLKEKLTKICNELLPNGGKSLRDVVNRIEQNTIRLENRLRAYIDLNNDTGVFETRADGNFIFTNKVLCDMLGLHPEQSCGNGWINGILHEDRQRVWDEWRDAVEQKREFNLEFRLSNALINKTLLVKCQAVPLVVDGKLQGWLGIIIPKPT